MAGSTAVLRIKIGADTYEFNRSVQKVTSGAQKMASDFSRIGRNMSMFFTAPMLAIAGMSTKLYDTQARSEAKVEQAIKSTNGAARQSFENLKRFASELQGKTVFGDEEILNKSTAQLLTFTNLAGTNFKRAQVAALDLSTVLDGDLQGASLQLGKALNDPVRSLSALRRSGVMFSKEQEEVIKKLAQTGKLAKAQSIMLSEIEKQYGGQAQRRAKEGAGGLIQLKNKWGDFLELVGRAVMPMLKMLSNILGVMVDWLSSLSGSTMSFVVSIGALIAVLGPTLIMVGQIIKLAPLMSKGFLAMVNPITLVIGAVVLLLAVLAKLASLGGDTVGRFVDQRDGKGIWTVENIEQAEKDYQNQIKKVQELKNEIDKNRRSYLQQSWDGLAEIWGDTTRKDNNELGKELQANENLLAAKGMLITKLREQKKELADNSNELKKAGLDVVILDQEVATLFTDINKSEKSTGIIAKLTDEIEKLEKIKLNETTTVGIASINSQIEKVKSQIESLNSLTAQYLAARESTKSHTGTTTTFITPKIKINIAKPLISQIDKEFVEIGSALRNNLNELGNDKFSAKMFSKLTASYTKGGAKMAKSMSLAIGNIVETMKVGVENLMRGVLASVGDGIVALMQGDTNIGEALAGILGNISSMLGNFIVQLGVDLLMASTVMQSFKAAIETFIVANPILAAGIALTMITVGALLSSGLKKKQADTVPKLAKGGLAYRPTYAMVGDNVGARVDPEVIAPLSKLKGIMGSGGGGNLNITISGKLTASGRDLSVILGKENYKIQVMGS